MWQVGMAVIIIYVYHEWVDYAGEIVYIYNEGVDIRIAGVYDRNGNEYVVYARFDEIAAWE